MGGWHLLQMPLGHAGCSLQPGLILQFIFSKLIYFPLINLNLIQKLKLKTNIWEINYYNYFLLKNFSNHFIFTYQFHSLASLCKHEMTCILLADYMMPNSLNHMVQFQYSVYIFLAVHDDIFIDKYIKYINMICSK